ncbi:MAG: hypothetical protein HC802_23115, partial [Caldilineaceae bacterium]|nr:hypothetical protein [Caldilineaceae bacterium]
MLDRWSDLSIGLLRIKFGCGYNGAMAETQDVDNSEPWAQFRRPKDASGAYRSLPPGGVGYLSDTPNDSADGLNGSNSSANGAKKSDESIRSLTRQEEARRVFFLRRQLDAALETWWRLGVLPSQALLRDS